MSARLEQLLGAVSDRDAFVRGLAEIDAAMRAEMQARLDAGAGGAPMSEAAAEAARVDPAARRLHEAAQEERVHRVRCRDRRPAHPVAAAGRAEGRRRRRHHAAHEQRHAVPGKPLAPWLTLMIVMGVFTFVFAYFRRFRGGRIALDVQHDLRTAIFRQLQRLDFARHDELADRSAREPRVVRRRAAPGLPAVPADRRREHPAVHRVVRRDVLALAAALARDARGRARCCSSPR